MKEKNQNELQLVKGFPFRDVLKVCGPIGGQLYFHRQFRLFD